MKTTMKTTMTLGAIWACDPSADSWKKLIAECGTSADDYVVDLRDILRSNGPQDAWWSTRCLPRRERVALALRAARTVERLSPAAKKCNDVTERWLDGASTDEELAAAWEAASAAWDADAAWDAASAERAALAAAWDAASAAWDAASALDAASAARAAAVGADAAWSVAARAAAVAARAALAEADAAWSEGAWSAGAWSAWSAAASAKADAWASLGEILRQWCDEQEEK
jgi:hypothetical protein